jgi:hypothetical protein
MPEDAASFTTHRASGPLWERLEVKSLPKGERRGAIGSFSAFQQRRSSLLLRPLRWWRPHRSGGGRARAGQGRFSARDRSAGRRAWAGDSRFAPDRRATSGRPRPGRPTRRLAAGQSGLGRARLTSESDGTVDDPRAAAILGGVGLTFGVLIAAANRRSGSGRTRASTPSAECSRGTTAAPAAGRVPRLRRAAGRMAMCSRPPAR